jgi:hypothetical protein
METRLNRWNAFALSLLLFAHFGYVSACGSLEAMHGAPGSQHICLNDLLNFSAASPDLVCISWLGLCWADKTTGVVQRKRTYL